MRWLHELKHLVFLPGLILLVTSNNTGWAQKPPPLLPANPQAPTLNMVLPLGMQRGSTMEWTLTGTNLAGPTGLLTSFPAKVTFPSDNKNGQDNAKLRVLMEVPADAPIGYHTIRLATTRGISNLRLFCIDDLAQVMEVDSNRNKSTPQLVPTLCVVAGRIDPEQSDYYKITVAAGQRLTFDVLGRRLGGPLDPSLTLYEARSFRELAHQNDSPGCQTDPRLTYTFKDAGDYVIEIKDVLNRGGAEYLYRLRIGDFPNATLPIPLAARRGSKATISFAGPMVEGVPPVTVTAPVEPGQDIMWVAPRGANGLYGWPVAVALSDHEELTEVEPNQEAARASRLPVPGGSTGRFQQSNDVDFYRFTAKKGQKLHVRADTLELYSPTLVYMVLRNAKNAEIARSNPEAAPPADQRIDFTAPADGDYLLEVQHLNYLGGPSEAYRVVVEPSTADFDLTAGLDRFDLAEGSPLPLTITAARRGHAGPIELAVGGHPGLTGTATIKAGQNSAVLVIQASPGLAMGPYAVSITGKATIDGKPVTRRVNVKAAVAQELGNLPYPPRDLFHEMALAVREKPPYILSARFEPPETYIGSTPKLKITARRTAGFDDVITLNPPANLPPNVPAPKVPPIAKGKNEITVDLAINPKVPLGDYQVLVSGKSRHQNKDFSAFALPAHLAVTRPFELKIEPMAVNLHPGEKAKLKITALRRGGYQGPIAVEIRKLPAGVTAAKAAIAQGHSSVDVELAAAARAAVTRKADVDALGVASAAGNQQIASPAFTVAIVKK
jgi:pre-peptidase